MPDYIRRRERPWFRKAGALLNRLPRAAHYRAEIELPFFNYYLKDKGPANRRSLKRRRKPDAPAAAVQAG